jgi:XRE family transcriptional regulator, regulator of sulfur utilization
MEHELRLKFGGNVRALRNKKGWSQEKLANNAGLTLRYIQMLESLDPPSAGLDVVEDIAKAFGISPATLLKLS